MNAGDDDDKVLDVDVCMGDLEFRREAHESVDWLWKRTLRRALKREVRALYLVSEAFATTRGSVLVIWCLSCDRGAL